MPKETIDTAMLTTTRARREIYQLIDEYIESKGQAELRAAGMHLKEKDLIALAAFAVQKIEERRKEATNAN